MKTYLLPLVSIVIFPVVVSAQTFSGDSILANERSIDRPITLHAGQLRVTGGYGLAIISRRYNLYGESIELRNEALSNLKHRFLIDVKYGINDFIEFTAAIAHSSNLVRREREYIVPMDPDPVVSHDVFTKYTGVEDLFVGIRLRAPLRTRKLDVAVTLGAALPVAPFEPEKPDHSFEFTREDDANIHKFVYRYHYPLGKGIAVAHVGAMAKYRTSRFAFSAGINYQHGLGDVKSFEWRHQMNDDNSFVYRRDPFDYRLPDSFVYYAETEYQPRRWMDIFLNVSGHTAYRGWISDEEDLKVAIPYQNSWAISPGAEIIITPEFWVRGQINFSIAGRNYDAPISFETSLMYNLFPFK